MNHPEVIRFAYQKGLRFDFETQELITSTGRRVKPKLYGGQRYPCYTIAVVKKERVSFHMHKFAGFILFGESALKPGTHVRHLDGNRMNLSASNLALGTASENELDKPKELRSRKALHARNVQLSRGIKSSRQVISDAQAEDVIRTYTALKKTNGRVPMGHWISEAAKYKVTTSAVKLIAYGFNFSSLHERIKNEQC